MTFTLDSVISSAKGGHTIQDGSPPNNYTFDIQVAYEDGRTMFYNVSDQSISGNTIQIVYSQG